MSILNETPSYYHPGISGSVYSKNNKLIIGHFGQLHPKIINLTYGFEIYLDNLVKFKENNTKPKASLKLSDYQKSVRDFAFLIRKNVQAQSIVRVIENIDNSLIRNIKIFDVYEGENIPSDKKSIALKVTIQSDFKTLSDKDLTEISDKIVFNVENKIGAKLRS